MKNKESNWSDQSSRMWAYDIKRKEDDPMPTRNITFQVTDNCSLRCTYCVLPNSLITLEDGTQKQISQIKVGEKVLGFDEKTENKKQRKLKSSTVEKVFRRKIDEDIYEITVDTGEKINITGNHRILSKGNRWKLPSNIKVGDKISCSPVNLTATSIDSIDQYEKGYLIGMFLGDGSIKQYYYENRGGCPENKIRLALKDTEPIQYCAKILKKNNINFYFKPYLISKIENLYTDAIFANSLDSYEKLTKIIIDNFGINTNIDYYRGFLAGIYDAEGHIDQNSNIIRISNTDESIINEIKKGNELLKLPYTVEERLGKNKPVYIIRYLSDNSQKKNSIAFKFYREVIPKITRKAPHFIDKVYLKCQEVIKINKYHYTGEVFNLQTSTSTYIANNFLVHNCYQINKGTRRMSFEKAKEFIDTLIRDDDGTYQAIILEFIGGEPFLEIDLINQITDYWFGKLVEENHRWATRTMISICSNGMHCKEPKVQKYLEKHKNHLSFTITIDGYKTLHDSCRVQPNGEGSYDIAFAASEEYRKKYGRDTGTKITIAPANLIFLYHAIKHFIENGRNDINANCVYEEGWTYDDAKEFYKQLKRIADYLFEKDLDDTVYISLFEEMFFKPMDPEDNKNWCFGKDTPVLTINGYKPIQEIKVGDLVLSNDGKYHKVTDTHKHFAENVVKTNISGAYSIICTDNHNFYNLPFDYIGNNYTKHYKSYTKTQLKNIKHNDLIHLSKLPVGTVDYPKSLAYILGRYIGDGWVSNNKYHICCAINEMEELKERLDDAQIGYFYNQNKTIYEFHLHKTNNPLINLIEKCGDKATTKRIPEECFKWNKESLTALLEGYWSADGTIHKSMQQHRCNTVSKELAYELLLILRTLGLNPTCAFNKRAGKSYIQNREVNIHNRYEVYYYDNPNRSRYVKTLNDNTWTYGMKYTPVEPQEVYNITVEDTHNYIAGDFVVSNCGGNGQMLSMDPDGYLYPCIRYMESSLGTDREPLRCGDSKNGVDDSVLADLRKITRRSQSTDECFNCPIASGCSWCSAYNYQVFGTVNKRATFICPMHKARALANVYFWNKYYDKYKVNKTFKNYVPKEWALEIIDEKEWDLLKSLEEKNSGRSINS